MEDIFDIRLENFAFLFSYEYLFLGGLVLFFAAYYFVALNFFKKKKPQDIIPKDIQTHQSEDENLTRILYLEKHLGDFDRGLFYREVGLFLRKCMFDIFGDNQIYFMTATELVGKYPSKFQSVFLVVYQKEFDAQSEDSLEERQNILQKIREITQ